MSGPLARFNHYPRQLRDRLGSDFLASLLVTLGAGLAFFALMALLIVALP